MRTYLIDTCFWYAMCDKHDQYFEEAVKIKSYIFNPSNKILFPWPILYEVCCTRFVKNLNAFNEFYKNIKILKENQTLDFLDDTKYREKALDNLLSGKYKNTKGENISLVDAVIWEILKDSNIRIDVIFTFNKKDFFSICKKKRIFLYYLKNNS